MHAVEITMIRMEFRSTVLFFSFAILALVSSSSSPSSCCSQRTPVVYTVGEKSGWVVNPSESYRSWSSRTKFLVHDKLVFKYKKGKDSVVQVTQKNYMNCNMKSPLKKMNSGNRWVEFGSPGRFYFISGKTSQCKRGQKLQVEVKSDTNCSSPMNIPVKSHCITTPPSQSPPPPVLLVSKSTPSSILVTSHASPSRSSSPNINGGNVGLGLIFSCGLFFFWLLEYF